QCPELHGLCHCPLRRRQHAELLRLHAVVGRGADPGVHPGNTRLLLSLTTRQDFAFRGGRTTVAAKNRKALRCLLFNPYSTIWMPTWTQALSACSHWYASPRSRPTLLTRKNVDALPSGSSRTSRASGSTRAFARRPAIRWWLHTTKVLRARRMSCSMA